MSAIRPAATRNAAKTMLYAFSTHDSDEIEVPLNDWAMLGKAMLTIVASTNATAAPSEAIASTRRGTAPAAADGRSAERRSAADSLWTRVAIALAVIL